MENGTFEKVMKWVATAIFVAVVGMAGVAMMCGCTTIRTVETTRTDTVWQNHTLHDSIHVRDSVWVEKWTQGDTVYVVKDRWKTEWRERLKNDTVYIAKHDTVRVEVKPTANAEGTSTLSWWQQTKMRVGGLVILMILAAVAFFLIRKKLPL